MQILKSIVGQSSFQLVVMYLAVFHADALFGVPNTGLADGPSLHYTLVFNVFVMMQLFNQVSPPVPAPACQLDCSCHHDIIYIGIACVAHLGLKSSSSALMYLHVK